MDSVVFDGREYTKASVVAEKFRYTQDYLGQLCRGKKVDARLVGRAWYVNIDSLTSHKDSRYKPATVKSAEISPKKAINNYLSRIDVEPILKNKTVRIFKAEKGSVSEVPVKYEADDNALIPKIYKEAISVELPVNPAGAESVRVRKVGNEQATFAPEELPEVYLRGTLSVAGIPEPTETAIPEEVVPKQQDPVAAPSLPVREIGSDVTNPVSIKRIASQPQIKPKTITVRPLPRSQATPKTTTPPLQRPVLVAVSQANAVVAHQSTPVVEPATPSVAARPTVATAPRFTPTLVVKRVEETVPPPSFFVRAVLPVSMLLIAFLCSGLILVTTSEVLATTSSYNDRLVFQTANLLELYELFSQQ